MIKARISAIALAVGLTGAGQAFSQGLMSIGADSDFESNLPFAVALATAVGWDSNVNLAQDGEVDSGYWQAGVVVSYGSGTPVTKLKVGGHYTAVAYFDPADGQDDLYHSTRLTLNVSHAASRRLKLGYNGLLSYDFQPDYLVGATGIRTNDQYFYQYHNFSAAYAWSRTLSTVTNYAITGVSYDEANSDDRYTHIFSNQFQYALTRVTKANLEYRFSWADYDDNGGADYTSHYALAGLDHSFSRQLAGSISVGAQFREYDGSGTTTSPHVEGALRYMADDSTSLRWYHRFGLDDSEASSGVDRTSYRTGIIASHRLSPRVTTTGGLHYILNKFEGEGTDFDDNVVALNLGVDYAIYGNVVLNATYSYTNIDSDLDFRGYDRQRVTLGASVTF